MDAVTMVGVVVWTALVLLGAETGTAVAARIVERMEAVAGMEETPAAANDDEVG
ncbi:hypothetical protein [Belnapia moabensis]|uniref:hypothetical protein n=1 Tax=Belnapia moabensis TaxID=365533 RepID=UPI0012ED7087|nr:hypothetical protein [Belnapia moabensis]